MQKVQDVAAYILETHGPMTSTKLHKLAFYGQAWHCVWNNERLFPEVIEAWVNGPVVRSLWNRMSGGRSAALTPLQRATLDRVRAIYGNKTARQLSNMTHKEKPWIDARQGLAPDAPSNRVITLESMREFYGQQDKQ